MVKTKREGEFIRIFRNQDQTVTTSVAAEDDIPESVKNAPVGSGETDLNPALLEDAEIIAIAYKLELTDPVEFFVTKRGSSKLESEEFSKNDNE